MSSRHIARTLSLQSLFEVDFYENYTIGDLDLKKIQERIADEFYPGFKDYDFSVTLAKETIHRRGTLDEIIIKAAPDWPLAKINAVDRSILRMSLYELLFGDRKDTPPKVAIDEGIELAKEFGGETSGKFVNGVLGAVYKEMGEPEKQQESKKSSKKEYLVGSVVMASHQGKLMTVLVHDVFGYWTLTKGKLASSEVLPKPELFKQAEEKIFGEIGLKARVYDSLGETEYIANKPDIGKVIRHVTYVLATTSYKEPALADKGGLDGVRWFDLEEVKNLKTYDDILPLIEKAQARYKD